MNKPISAIAAISFYVLLIIYFTGCGANKETYTLVDGEFSAFVSEFNLLHGNQNYNVIIQFGNRTDVAGTCETMVNGQKVINISRGNWDSYCIEQQRGIIFHELGHCVLDRAHTTNIMSYMYDTVRPCGFYMTNIPALDNELFN